MARRNDTVSGVDDVLVTDDLEHRPRRAPDYQAEAQALRLLAQEMASNPAGVLQTCAKLVMELCHADAAGISILEPGGTNGIFRWHAAVGAFAGNLYGTMPREESPCGTVMARNSVLLFNEAERFFPALREVEPRIYENLLAPWHVKGEAAGTLWAIKHTPEGRFDAEDARLLQSLSGFASAAFQMVTALKQAEAGRDELERQVEERTVALLEANRTLQREVAERTQAEAELRESEAETKLLLAELQHRVKNTLAVVRSIARRSARTSESVEEYVMHLDGRIDAFARVQAAVARRPTAGIDLETLVADGLVAVWAREGDQVKSIAGPRVSLRPKAAETVALVIHELATNALKYGALSDKGGRIQVTWRVEQAESGSRLIFGWLETGMKLSGELPTRRGFGLELIEDTLSYELGGEASLRFAQQGLHCIINLPLTELIIVDDGERLPRSAFRLP